MSTRATRHLSQPCNLAHSPLSEAPPLYAPAINTIHDTRASPPMTTTLAFSITHPSPCAIWCQLTMIVVLAMHVVAAHPMDPATPHAPPTPQSTVQSDTFSSALRPLAPAHTFTPESILPVRAVLVHTQAYPPTNSRNVNPLLPADMLSHATVQGGRRVSTSHDPLQPTCITGTQPTVSAGSCC